MSKELTTNTANALAQRIAKKRDFIWFTGWDFSTRATHTAGFWNDLGNVTAEYQDVDSGETLSRTYVGAGGLIKLDAIPLVNDITVRNVTITCSQLTEELIDAILGYDVHGAPIEVHRGFFYPGTWKLVDPLTPRFVGFIDYPEITHPQKGNDGQVVLNCVSHTRLLTRVNPDVRSDASQRLRNGGDAFLKDVSTVGTWQIWWGEEKTTIAAALLQSSDVQKIVNNASKR